nr:hypothetical protein [Tanacetum cinerariifolium]
LLRFAVGAVQGIPFADAVEIHLVEHQVAALHERVGGMFLDAFRKDFDGDVAGQLVDFLGHHQGLVTADGVHGGAELAVDVADLERIRVSASGV